MTRSPRVLVAPNAFKGTLSARDAARAMARGVRRALPSARVDEMPVSDGGDGLAEVLLSRLGGRRVVRVVTGPLGRPKRAAYALLHGGREAVIEMAQASGIAGLKRHELDPVGATSRGVGELIADALRQGARRILVGMGGSASSDGGAGMAQALGARLLDARGRELPAGAGALARLERVELGALPRLLRGARVVAVSDVRNPLLGPSGSARVYGPQKGATPREVERLESALARYARVLARDLGRRVERLPGAGAAGGLGAGLAAFLGARLVGGADFVLARLDARARAAKSDLVLTGEGRLDEQSFFGKAPVAVARLARSEGVPVRFLCGQVAASASGLLRPWGRRAAWPLARDAREAELAMRDCRLRLAAVAAAAVRDAVAAGLLALALAPAAFAQSTSTVVSTGAFAEADRLYFSRHQPGRLEKAHDLLRDASDAPGLWRLSRCLVRLGERETKKGKRLERFRQAEKAAARAVELDPKSAEAHFALGLSLGRRGETQGLMSSLFLVGPIRRAMETTLALDPSHSGAHHVLGEMLRRLPRLAGGSKTEGLRHLERSLELGPGRTAVYVDLARAYLDAKEKARAREVLERLLKVTEPSDPAEHEDDVAEARRLLERL
ncbi:MAG: glycerate kinase [Elusimicrobia bacterium]|nr:glycerate kinase [Elusimicrobiota bacterium]